MFGPPWPHDCDRMPPPSMAARPAAWLTSRSPRSPRLLSLWLVALFTFSAFCLVLAGFAGGGSQAGCLHRDLSDFCFHHLCLEPAAPGLLQPEQQCKKRTVVHSSAGYKGTSVKNRFLFQPGIFGLQTAKAGCKSKIREPTGGRNDRKAAAKD